MEYFFAFITVVDFGVCHDHTDAYDEKCFFVGGRGLKCLFVVITVVFVFFMGLFQTFRGYE